MKSSVYIATSLYQPSHYDFRLVQQQLGPSISTTSVYGVLVNQDLADALEHRDLGLECPFPTLHLFS